MSDLDRLIKAVEAGTWDGDMRMPAEWHPTYITQSYYGSFDAALSLKEALLPGWSWGRALQGNVWVKKQYHQFHWSGDKYAKNPARALLLAVLKAYRETRG